MPFQELADSVWHEAKVDVEVDAAWCEEVLSQLVSQVEK